MKQPADYEINPFDSYGRVFFMAMVVASLSTWLLLWLFT